VRRLHNWTYRNVTDFPKENGFVFLEELAGPHERWIKRSVNGEADQCVEINFIHGRKSYPERTLKTMVWQLGIDQKEWIKWAGS
jgi:hypothetical protein